MSSSPLGKRSRPSNTRETAISITNAVRAELESARDVRRRRAGDRNVATRRQITATTAEELAAAVPNYESSGRKLLTGESLIVFRLRKGDTSITQKLVTMFNTHPYLLVDLYSSDSTPRGINFALVVDAYLIKWLKENAPTAMTVLMSHKEKKERKARGKKAANAVMENAAAGASAAAGSAAAAGPSADEEELLRASQSSLSSLNELLMGAFGGEENGLGGGSAAPTVSVPFAPVATTARATGVFAPSILAGAATGTAAAPVAAAPAPPNNQNGNAVDENDEMGGLANKLGGLRTNGSLRSLKQRGGAKSKRRHTKKKSLKARKTKKAKKGSRKH